MENELKHVTFYKTQVSTFKVPGHLFQRISHNGQGLISHMVQHELMSLKSQRCLKY